MNLETPFLISLAIVAVGAFGVGWFLRRIVSVRKYNELVEHSQYQVSSLKSSLADAKAAQSAQEKDLHSLRSQLSIMDKSRSKVAREQQSALTALQVKEQRINELEAQVSTAEEQYLRLQRDLTKLRLQKKRAIQQGHTGVETSDYLPEQSATFGDSDLPVLKKKLASAVDADHPRYVDDRQQQTAQMDELTDLSNEVLETDEDVFDMTSEFDFDPEELLVDENSGDR